MSMEQAIQSFITEASDILEDLEGQLLALETAPCRDTIDAVFRAMHTLKGSGGMFGYGELAAFTHHLETAFEQVRDGELAVSAQLVSVALRARDLIVDLLEVDGGSAEAAALVATPEAQAILADLEALMQAPVTAPGGAPADATASSQPLALKTGHRQFRVTYRPAPLEIVNGTRPDLLVQELLDLGTGAVTFLVDRIPTLDHLDFDQARLGYRVEVHGDLTELEIDNVFIFADDAELDITQLEPAAATAPDQETPDAPPRGGTAVQTTSRKTDLRVSGERVDQIMDAIGELVISQARLDQVASKHHDPDLEGVIEEVERLVLALRDTTLSIRMLPIETVFGKFNRVVRDLSVSLGKEVDLRTVGGETEIDKNVIDRLNEPLVHMIRNSLDHGIENGSDRALAGKPPRGTLLLEARQEGGEVVIEVSDDGRGLDPEAIRAKAEQVGVIAPGAQLSEQETCRLIFAPGFSTAQEVSDVSGRGVGMDAVQTAIEELRGTVNVTSTLGEGTRFSLRLPLSLAIIEGLRVRLGDQVFVIPLSIVDECVELPPDTATHATGRRILEIRNELVPFVPLEEVLNLPPAPLEDEETRRVVIANSDNNRTGFLVDEVLGQAQTVIKPLSVYHRGIPGLSGATILGDGAIALILDMVALAQIARTDILRAVA